MNARRCLLPVLLLLSFVAMATAQTTGSIVGRVTNEGGGVLPGVTVEARSPAHLGYPLTVGPATINILVDVFNLLDAQKAVVVDERWDFQEADNASPTPTNPSYGKPVLRTPPRSYRLGLRLSF